MLVLGMASLANATLQLAISVDGDDDPLDSEYTIAPSEHLELDIHGSTDAGESVYWMMLVKDAEGTITGGNAAAGSLSSIFPAYYTVDSMGYMGIDSEVYNGISGSIADVGAIAGPVLVDLIDFHCEAPGDATVELWTGASDSTGAYTLVDTAVIHQIPEPMTMVLLGLGGLFLRRRK